MPESMTIDSVWEFTRAVYADPPPVTSLEIRVWECVTCSAMVKHPQTHVTWHEGL